LSCCCCCCCNRRFSCQNSV